MRKGLMMKIPLVVVGGLTGVIIIDVLILKIGDFTAVVVIMMTPIILLVSS
jgi:hypothetical protein